jgi:hypothetical protein
MRIAAGLILVQVPRADVGSGNGETVKEVCRTLEITGQTRYRWRLERHSGKWFSAFVTGWTEGDHRAGSSGRRCHEAQRAGMWTSGRHSLRCV